MARPYEGLDEGTTPDGTTKGRATDTAAKDMKVKTVMRLENCILAEVDMIDFLWTWL